MADQVHDRFERAERATAPALGDVAKRLRYPHEAAQDHFNLVLARERDFWTMS